MLRVLEHRDVAGVVVDAHALVAEVVHERVHLHRRHQEAVEEDVLHVEINLLLRGGLGEDGNGFLRTLLANVIAHRFVIGAPRNVHRAGHDEHVLHAKVASGLGNLAGEFEAARALCRVVARKRIRPEEERAQPADLDANLVSHLADGFEVFRSGLGREVVVEVVVELDAVEARVLRELEALAEIHAVRVGEGPEIDGLLHRVALGGGAARVWLGDRLCGGRASADHCGGSCGGEGRAQSVAARESIARGRLDGIEEGGRNGGFRQGRVRRGFHTVLMTLPTRAFKRGKCPSPRVEWLADSAA